MTDDIVFDERDLPIEVDLSPSDWRALRRARGALTIRRLSADKVLIGPRPGYVGSLQLPRGGRIVVEPKAPVEELVGLLALAYRTLVSPERVGPTGQECAEPNDWFVLLLVTEVEYLLARGLRRGYVSQIQALPYVRGRIRPDLTARTINGHLVCEYSDFIQNTVENRLLRGALEVAAAIPHALPVRRRLSELLAQFDGVAFERPSLRAFDRLTFSRLNAHYGPALQLCRLLLEGAGLVEGASAAPAPALFVPMWRVFERAVAAALQDAGLAVSVGAQYSDRIVHVDGHPDLGLTLIPDIILDKRSEPSFVVDTKYSRPVRLHHGTKRYKNEHVYQLATYCRALDCSGLLLYPQFDEEVRVTYNVAGSKVGLWTVDLTRPELQGLREFAAELSIELSLPSDAASALQAGG